MDDPRTSEVRPVAHWPAESWSPPITIWGEVWCSVWSIWVAMVRVIPAWWTLLHPRDISPLRCNLNLATMQLWFIQIKSFLDSFLFQKFNISKTFWLPKLVGQDCHPIDSSTSLEVLLYFFWCTRIINLCTTQVISLGTSSYERHCIRCHLQSKRPFQVYTAALCWRPLLRQGGFLNYNIYIILFYSSFFFFSFSMHFFYIFSEIFLSFLFFSFFTLS